MAESYRSHLRGSEGALCFITVGELYAGARRKAWGARKFQKLEEMIGSFFLVEIDIDVCRAYARPKSEAKTSQGSDRVLETNDLWIAACAIRHNIPLLSNNRRHFEGLSGFQLISEAP